MEKINAEVGIEKVSRAFNEQIRRISRSLSEKVKALKKENPTTMSNKFLALYNEDLEDNANNDKLENLLDEYVKEWGGNDKLDKRVSAFRHRT